jgi:hypothetical protein
MDGLWNILRWNWRCYALAIHQNLTRESRGASTFLVQKRKWSVLGEKRGS